MEEYGLSFLLRPKPSTHDWSSVQRNPFEAEEPYEEDEWDCEEEEYFDEDEEDEEEDED